jgi:hypothetical protein
MKTKAFILSALAIFLASAVFATKLPTMKIVPAEKSKTIVAFETGTTSGFELTVKNLQGETLYYKKSEEPVDSYRTVFDFSNLNDGPYQVSLNTGNCTVNRKLTISGNRVQLGEETRLFAPVYSFQNNMLNVSFLNKGQKYVFLNVFQDGDYVSGAKLGKAMCIQKTLDFSKLPEGTYQVVLSDKFKDYSYTVVK